MRVGALVCRGHGEHKKKAGRGFLRSHRAWFVCYGRGNFPVHHVFADIQKATMLIKAVQGKPFQQRLASDKQKPGGRNARAIWQHILLSMSTAHVALGFPEVRGQSVPRLAQRQVLLRQQAALALLALTVPQPRRALLAHPEPPLAASACHHITPRTRVASTQPFSYTA